MWRRQGRSEGVTGPQKRLVIFHFFVPDPKEALETLIERGSPMSVNSPASPGYARNLGTETCWPWSQRWALFLVASYDFIPSIQGY